MIAFFSGHETVLNHLFILLIYMAGSHGGKEEQGFCSLCACCTRGKGTKIFNFSRKCFMAHLMFTIKFVGFYVVDMV